jgi:putative oxidoreductase
MLTRARSLPTHRGDRATDKLHLAAKVLFGGARNISLPADVGRLVLRLVAGLTIALLHGLGKVPPAAGFVDRIGEMGLPFPVFFAWLAAIGEFGGGLLLAAGLLTRPAALLLVGHFAVVVSMAHAGDPVGERELAVLFGAISFFYLLAGAGRFSLDGLLRRRLVEAKESRKPIDVRKLNAVTAR